MVYELIIKKAKKIEKLLSKLGGEGKGLHEKATSIDAELDEGVIKKVRYLATVRNRLVHEDDFELDKDDLSAYKKVSVEVTAVLNKILLDRENEAKRVSVIICQHCGKASTPQVIFEDKHPLHSICVLCANILDKFETPIEEPIKAEPIKLKTKFFKIIIYGLKVLMHWVIVSSVILFGYYMKTKMGRW